MHLVGVEVDLQAAQELVGILDFLLPFENLAQPGEPLDVLFTVAAGRLVAPVGGDALFRHPVHIRGANLDLEVRPRLGHQARMEGLVAVDARHGDEVLDAPRDGLPHVVNHSQRRVAVGHRVGDQPQGDEVVHLIEFDLLPVHLAIDGIDALGAAGQLTRDRLRLQLAFQRPAEITNEVFGPSFLGLDPSLEDLVGLGFEVAQRQILKLGFDPPDSESARDRGVDVQRLGGDPLPLLLPEKVKCPHVVQPIGELDQDDPGVVGHRDDHLANVFRLVGFRGTELHTAQLGEAVDHPAHIPAEPPLQILVRDFGVLDHVVEEAASDGDDVELQIREDPGHLERMVQIGLARETDLSLMRLGGHHVGRAEQVEIGVGLVRADPVPNRLEPNHRLPVSRFTLFSPYPSSL